MRPKSKTALSLCDYEYGHINCGEDATSRIDNEKLSVVHCHWPVLTLTLKVVACA